MKTHTNNPISDPYDQLYVGLISWFAEEKGYGVAVVPGKGEVFLHKNNFRENIPFLRSGTALFFKVANRRGKKSGLEIRRPCGSSDLRYLLRKYGMVDAVYLESRNSRGHTSGRSYNVVSEAIIQVLSVMESEIAWKLLSSYAEKDLKEKGTEEYRSFFRLVAQDLKRQIGKMTLPDHYNRKLAYLALEKARSEIKFDVWQAIHAQEKLLTPRSLEDELDLSYLSGVNLPVIEPIEIDQQTILQKVHKLESSDLVAVIRFKDGASLFQQVLLLIRHNDFNTFTEKDFQSLESLLFAFEDVYDIPTQKEYCKWLLSACDIGTVSELLMVCTGQRTFGRSQENPPLPVWSIVEVLQDRPTKLLEKMGEDALLNVLFWIRERLDEKAYHEAIAAIHKTLGQETVLRLWRLRKYFHPDGGFFSQHLEELSPAELKFASKGWQQEYYSNQLTRYLPGSSLVDLALIGGYCNEAPDVVLAIATAQVEPLEHVVALHIAYDKIARARTKSSIFSQSKKQNEVTSETGKNQYQNYIEPEIIAHILQTPIVFLKLVECYHAAIVFKQYRSWDLYGGERLFGGEEYREKAREAVKKSTDGLVEDVLREALDRLEQADLIETLVVLLTQPSHYVISVDQALQLINETTLDEHEKQLVYERAYNLSDDFLKATLWLYGKVQVTDLDVLSRAFFRLSHIEQRQFIRRLFRSAANKEIKLVLGYLTDLMTDPQTIDLNVQVAIKALESLHHRRHLPESSTLSEIIASYVGNRVEDIVQIDDFFDRCPGRTVLDRRVGEYRHSAWYAIIGRQKFHVENDLVQIENKYFPFDRESKTIHLDGNRYSFRWKKEENVPNFAKEHIPTGITFCEGRKAKKTDDETRRAFYWCSNKPCFSPLQSHRPTFLWESFSLRDFARILKLPFEEEHYLRFLTLLNRTNQLLHRLTCKGCERLLRPVSSSAFAFYRVTTFHCTYVTCTLYQERVYLTHCLNWRCKGVVDSRESVKCPNGWYICASCGSCCSHKQIERRLEHLKKTGSYNHDNWKHQTLLNQFEKRLGHEELGKKYNHRTGEPLN